MDSKSNTRNIKGWCYMSLSAYERETIINWSQEDETASVYTHDKSLLGRLRSFCTKDASVICVFDDETVGEYNVPKKYIKLQLPRNLSDEERKRRRDVAKSNFGKK